MSPNPILAVVLKRNFHLPELNFWGKLMESLPLILEDWQFSPYNCLNLFDNRLNLFLKLYLEGVTFLITHSRESERTMMQDHWSGVSWFPAVAFGALLSLVKFISLIDGSLSTAGEFSLSHLLWLFRIVLFILPASCLWIGTVLSSGYVIILMFTVQRCNKKWRWRG